MGNFLILIYHFFQKQRIILSAIILFCLLIIGYFASKIKLEEDISKTTSAGNDKINLFIKHSGLTNKLILNIFLKDSIASADPDKLIAFADELADSLKNKKNSYLISSTTFKINDSLIEDVINFFYDNLPVFLNKNDYQKIDSLILSKTIESSLEKDYKTLLSPAGFALKKFIIKDPIGISALALKKLKQFQIEDDYEIREGYIFTKNKRNLIVFINPANPSSETSKNAVLLNQLDKLFKNISAKNNNSVQAEYYGAAAVAVGNAEQIKKDIALTVTISLLIILVFVGWFFKNAKIPFISFLPAVFGGGMALTILFILKSNISTIALGIGSVLLGIIVDYALYIFSIYKSKGSVEAVLKDMSLTIFLCSLTTATAFFSLLFVKSEVLRDLGLFAGLSVLGAAFFSLIFLPHFIKLKTKNPDNKIRKTFIDKIAEYKFESNIFLIILILVITTISFFTFRKATFETDMYSMNFLPDKLKQAEKNLDKINKISLKSVYLVSTGKNLDQALANDTKVSVIFENLEKNNIVKKYSNVSSVLISNFIQKERIKKWKSYWTLDKQRKLEDTIIKYGQKARFKKDAFNDFYNLLNKDFQPIEISQFVKIRKLFLNDMITETPDLSMVVSMLKVNNEDRNKVFSAFSEMKNVVVIDKQKITLGFIENIKIDFDLMVKLCLVFVSVVLIISFGRIEIGLIASLPMFVSWLWTLGIMGMFGLKFNIFNILISTFIFGLGVDYSILMMRGLLLEYKYGTKELPSYKTSIFLSAFTTIVGVGVLIFAKHPSLNSISILSIIGMFSVVIVSYTIEPILFRWLVNIKNKKRVVPITFFNLAMTLILYTITFICCVIMNLSLLLIVLIPLPRKKKKIILHYIMMYCCRVIVYSAINIKKKIINSAKEDFSKPSIIISNHQSHLDLLLIIMLNPKIIVITKKWVWYNPLYGLVIRYLDYFPIMEGYENIMKQLSKIVEEGYSILIFPEGTRTETPTIKRFHKGAFYIAEQLQLDILPIMIHGAIDCMNKGENYIKSGSLTVKIFDRIKSDDNYYGNDYHEHTKSILRFYRTEYEKLKEEAGTPTYFRDKLIKNYLYKGPVLEWYMRIKLRLENNYELFNQLIPRDAEIVDIGCGYGAMSYMLSFISPKRKITAIDYDENKLEVAKHFISKLENINFIYADISEYPISNSDVFIMSDILHYMPEEKQEQLIIKCIEHLNNNGIIIIRDGNKDLKKRHWGTIYTEFFSTRFGFNKCANNELFFISGKKIIDIAVKCKMRVEIIDNTKLTSNLIYLIKNNQTKS